MSKENKKAARLYLTPDEYSGRISLRLPRSMHEKAVLHAADDGVSMNQFLVAAIAYYLGTQEEKQHEPKDSNVVGSSGGSGHRVYGTLREVQLGSTDPGTDQG